MRACTVCVLHAPAVLQSHVSRDLVACAYALIVTMLRALRSEVSSSSETGGTFPLSYMCIHSACLAPASCTMVFSQLIHTLKGMHVHYHCLLPLKGNMNVSFGARQHVLNGYFKQNYGECKTHFFASYTVCLARPSRRLLHPHNSDERLHIETVRRQPRCTYLVL